MKQTQMPVSLKVCTADTKHASDMGKVGCFLGMHQDWESTLLKAD